jgi:uncharacterized membrane protein YkoI
MKIVTVAIGALALACGAIAESRVKMEDLPPAVQRAAREQSKNATLVGLSKEVEGGKTVYEVETKVNGKTRDLLLDQSGAVVEIEEEVDLDSLPPAAKEAIQQKLAGRKLKKVEAVTKDSTVSYEASYAGKLGKTSEFAVNADGTTHK